MITALGNGRFVQDPVLQQVETPNKTTHVCNFTLAIDEHRRVGNEKVKSTSFFDCEIWDSAAETIASYCKKGDTLIFKARPRQNKWESDDGPRSKVVFRIEEFSIINRRRDDEDGDNDE